jgi:hypothetical protein
MIRNWMYQAILSELSQRSLDLRRVSEPMRQRLIDLAMCEPPLVDVDADRVFLTEAGRRACSVSSPHGNAP